MVPARPADMAEGQSGTRLLSEQLRGEKNRAVIVFAVFGVMGLVGLIVLTLFEEPLGDLTGDARFFNLIVFALIVFLLFEAALGWYFARAERLAIHPPRSLFVVTTVVEALAPSAFILALSSVIPGGQAVDAPPLLIYFVLIILSTLRLDPKLSVLTGLVSAAGYLPVGLISMREAADFAEGSLNATALPHVARAIMMVLSGLLAAFVAREILRRQALAEQLRGERQRVVDIFGQHVSPEVVDAVLADDTGLKSEHRYVCVMFMDVRDFTTFSETRSPDEVVGFLNKLFEPMVDVVSSHHGVINKFLGDGFMAVFGAPVSDGRDSENALRAALRIVDVFDEMKRQGAIADVEIGLALHSGEATTGTIGSRRRKEYTVVGDTVNVASRIEALNKSFSSRLLVSEDVWDLVADRIDGLSGEPMEPVHVKGRSGPIRCYRILSA